MVIVVHFPFGTYSINKTIVVPASDLQLVGDGYLYATTIQWNGTGNAPIFDFRGPSHVTIREMQIEGHGLADGILLGNADQSGARVYMDQPYLNGAKASNLFVNGLDHLELQLENFQHSGSLGSSVKVLGGALSSSGQQGPGRVNIFSGASSNNFIYYEVTNGGRLLVEDIWGEGGSTSSFLKAYGRAEVTYASSRANSPALPTPAFLIDNLVGSVSLLTIETEENIGVTGDGSFSKVLAMGFYHERQNQNYFSNSSSPAADARRLLSRNVTATPGSRSEPTSDIGVSDPAFLRTMMKQARTERPQPLISLSKNLTDFRLFRVSIGTSVNGIQIKP